MPWDDDPYITPREARQATYRWAPTLALWAAGLALVVVIIVVVGWLAGGWFQSHGIQRSYSNTVNSQAYQQALSQEMTTHLGNISGLASTRQGIPASSGEQVILRAQQLGDLREFCSESVNYHPDPSSIASQQLATDVAQNCTAGAIVADPPLVAPIPSGAS